MKSISFSHHQTDGWICDPQGTVLDTWIDPGPKAHWGTHLTCLPVPTPRLFTIWKGPTQQFLPQAESSNVLYVDGVRDGRKRWEPVQKMHDSAWIVTLCFSFMLHFSPGLHLQNTNSEIKRLRISRWQLQSFNTLRNCTGYTPLKPSLRGSHSCCKLGYCVFFFIFLLKASNIYSQAFAPSRSCTDEQPGGRSGILEISSIIFRATVLHIPCLSIGWAKQTKRQDSRDGP